jgi:hypothetical protein
MVVLARPVRLLAGADRHAQRAGVRLREYER